MMNGFLHQHPSLPETPIEQAQLGQVRLDAAQGAHLRAQSASPPWADDFPVQAAMESFYNVPPGTQFGVDEFAKFRAAHSNSTALSQPTASLVSGHPRPMLGVGAMNMGTAYGMMSRP